MSRYSKTGRGGANRGKAWGAALRAAQVRPVKVRCEGSGQPSTTSVIDSIDLKGRDVRWVTCPRCGFVLRGTKSGLLPTHKRDAEPHPPETT